MSLEIRRVTEPAELAEVFRLRYRVYVQELQYPQRYADHRSQMVREPLDEMGHILGAFEDGALVGSVRINYGSAIAFGDYGDLYTMSQCYGSMKSSMTNWLDTTADALGWFTSAKHWWFTYFTFRFPRFGSHAHRVRGPRGKYSLDERQSCLPTCLPPPSFRCF
jgi:hypothetical protein